MTLNEVMSALKSKGHTIDEIVDMLPETVPDSKVEGIEVYGKHFHNLMQQKNSKLRKK